MVDSARIDLLEKLDSEQYELLLRLSLSLSVKDLIIMKSILKEFGRSKENVYVTKNKNNSRIKGSEQLFHKFVV